MKLTAVLFVMALTSCTTTQPYYWGKYMDTVYKDDKKQTDESEEKLVAVYEDIIAKKHKGTRNQVPPGIYADFGLLLINRGEIEKGKKLLEMELQLYPESKKMIEYTLSKLSK